MEYLRTLGLTQYEIGVYMTLLKEGTLIGSRIHRLSKVPHGKTYESLVKLEEKGLITVSKSKPKEYTAIDPKISIQHITRAHIEQLQHVKHAAIQELGNIKKPARTEMREKVRVGAGKQSIFPIVLDMYETAKNEVKEIFTYEERPFSHIHAVRAALDKGIKVKFLITQKPKTLKHIQEDLKAGVEIRYYPIDEVRFVIKDKEACIQTIINPRDRRDRISIYFQSAGLSKALSVYFDDIWKKAERMQ